MLYKGDTLYLDWLEDGIAELVFDATGSVNKLDTATVASLGQALDVLEKQPGLKGLLLRSEKAAFIVGADITEFLSLFQVPPEQLSQWLHFANSVFCRLEDLPVPTISAVNGYALGGGCELVMCADIVIAGSDARFGQPEINLGIIPGAGGTQRLLRAVGKPLAMQMVLTGEAITARHAQQAGLVSEITQPEFTVERAMQIARNIAAKAPLAVRLAKEALLKAGDTDLASGLRFARQAFTLLAGTAYRDEGIQAFQEKRPARFQGR